jgi:AcrR family transcriptional regulator
MATTRAEQAEQTRRKVLETARRLFAAQGYDATSLQKIADAMDVTKANVYYYFHTKAEILEAITAEAQGNLAKVFDAAEKVRGRQARIEFVINGFVDLVMLQRAMVPLGIDPGMRRQERIATAADDLARRGLRVLFGDQPTRDEVAAFVMVSDLGPVLRAFPDLPADELREVLVRLCLRVVPQPARKGRTTAAKASGASSQG